MLSVTYEFPIISGQQMPKELVSVKPILKLRGKNDKLYTVLFVDPDALKRDWLHWAIINYDGKTYDELIDYAKPNLHSRVHRYIFYLCQQSTPLTLQLLNKRPSFNTINFLEDNMLKVVENIFFTI